MSSKPVALRLISTNRPQNLIIGPLSYAHILETETGATTSFFGVAHTLSDAAINSLGKIILLGKHIPALFITALVRGAASLEECTKRLRELHKKLDVVEGGLHNTEIIRREAETAKIVINAADADHITSIQDTIKAHGRRAIHTRVYYIAAKLLDQTVTFGPGYNKLGHIHAQDVASALLSLTRVVLDGTAHAGAEGIYGLGMVDESGPSHWVPKIFYEQGLVSTPGLGTAQSADGTGFPGYIFQVVAGNLIGYPQRLKKFGWRQIESSKVGFLGAAKTEAYVLLEEVKEETTAK